VGVLAGEGKAPAGEGMGLVEPDKPEDLDTVVEHKWPDGVVELIV